MPNDYSLPDDGVQGDPFTSLGKFVMATLDSGSTSVDEITEKVASTQNDVAVEGIQTAFAEGFKAAMDGTSLELQQKIASEELGTLFAMEMVTSMAKSINDSV